MTDFEFNNCDNMVFENISYIKISDINVDDLKINDNEFDEYINNFYDNIDMNVDMNTNNFDMNVDMNIDMNVDMNVDMNINNFDINVDMNINNIEENIDNNINVKTKPKSKYKYRSIVCKEHKRFRYSCKDCYESCMKLGYKSAYCEHLINKKKCNKCKDIVSIRSYIRKNKEKNE